MARSIETIKSAIKTEIRTYTELNSFLFPEEGGSLVGVMNVIIYSVAVAIYTFEVLLDTAKIELQDIADTIPAGNPKWVQTQIKNFQYGDVVTFVDNVPAYNPVTPANRIVTQCSVVQSSGGIVTIKVAKGTVPSLAPLAGAELSALKDYYYGTQTSEGIGFAGVKTNFISLDADRIYLEGEVYYSGQYVSTTVKANVITAINEFLASFTDEAFDGTIFINRITDAVENVDGVVYVKWISVKARPNTTAFAGASVVNVMGSYQTIAGYAIAEDDTGNTPNDKITMIEV